MAVRYDQVKVPDWISSKFEMTSDGKLVGRAACTNIGVFTYRKMDGTVVRELRTPDEVFKAESMDSIKNVPITIDHIAMTPSEEDTVGRVGNYPLNGGNIYLSVDLQIERADAIDEVKKGKQYLSCGYQCDIREESGKYLGMDYDAVQENIHYLHLALVDSPRAGETAKIRLDDADAILVSDEKENKTDIVKEEIMAEEKKADTSEVKDAVKEAITEVKVDELQAKIDALTTEKTTLEAERDTLKDKVDSLEKKVGELETAKMDVDGKKTDIKRLIKLIDSARLAEVEVTDAMSEIDIQKAVIVKIFPKANLDGKDEVYINARFDGAMEALENKNDEEVRKLSSDDTVVVDSEENIVDKARKAYLDRLTGKK